MRKLLVFVALFAAVGVSTTAGHAQDGGSKSLTVYADGSSGTLNPDVDGNGRAFKGNELETGLTYNQSFGNGLSYFIKGRILGGVTMNDTDLTVKADEDPKTAEVRGDYSYNLGGFRVQTGIGYGINGFSTSITLNSQLLATASVGYGMSLGNAGSLSLGSDVEFYMAPKAYITDELTTSYGSKPDESKSETVTNVVAGVLDLFQVHIGYTVPFAERWSFNTKAMFRFGNGGVTDDMRAAGYYADVNAFAFVNSFHIRWDNTISVNATDNLSIYGRVRYQANNLAQKTYAVDGDGVPKNEWKAMDVDHRVSLHVGMAYKFDF